MIDDYPNEDFQDFKTLLVFQSDPGGATAGNQI
jgi:hypothetical protein